MFFYKKFGFFAKAVRENGAETFAWDGLALIERNGTKYINEPHAGGGNPILAIGESSEDAIFNDILGTSLGVVKDGGYSAIDKTSFGADSTDKSSFFTGKPYVEDLGYAFLFRNYRADLGKWQMRDLIGYPDGWNNLAYCNNSITMWVDLLGGKVFWAARDLKGSPIGNHHFLLYIPDSPSNFSGETIDLGGGKKGFTQGGFKEEGMLVKRDNDTTDVKTAKEFLITIQYFINQIMIWKYMKFLRRKG